MRRRRQYYTQPWHPGVPTSLPTTQTQKTEVRSPVSWDFRQHMVGPKEARARRWQIGADGASFCSLAFGAQGEPLSPISASRWPRTTHTGAWQNLPGSNIQGSVQGSAGCTCRRSRGTGRKSGCPVIALQLQKLKRSLSFKTKSLRSKSADNFFPRTNSDVKLQADLLAKASMGPSPGPNPMPIPGSPASMPARAGLHPGSNNKVHAFQEHVFKKPTFCDVCNHMIVGKTPYRCITYPWEAEGELGPEVRRPTDHL